MIDSTRNFDRINFEKIVFSGHAHQQIRERNLTETQIRSVMRHSHKIISQSINRFRVSGILSTDPQRRVLVVIYDVIDHDQKKIVTAFLSSKIKKYL